MAKILVVTRTKLEERSGASFHLRNMMECLKDVGHEIHCAIFSENIYDLPLTSDELKLASEAIDSCKPDVVMADYSWMADVFDLTSKWILNIVFVHDLRCRIVPCLEKIGYNDHYGWTEEKEAKLLRKADVLMVLNDDDEAFCKRMAPDVKIIRIGIAMDPVQHDPEKEIPGRMIYVCSGSKENEYALNEFLNNVFPLVKKEVPHASLIVVEQKDDLEKRYAEAQVAVVPHIMHGGLKIKTAEAFAHGVPVVGNSCAFDGFEDVDGGPNDPEEMADGILRYFKRDDIRKDISEYYYRKMTIRSNKAYAQLLDILV